MKPPYLDTQGRPRPPNMMERHTPYIRWRRSQRRREWILFGLMMLGFAAAAGAYYVQERQRQPVKECR